MHCLHGMPVVRRRDDHGIDVLSFDDVAVIAIWCHAGSRIAHGGFEAVLIRVANRGNLHFPLRLEAQHVLQVSHTHATPVPMWAIVRRPLAPGRPGGGQHAGRKNGETTESQGRCAQKLAPAEFVDVMLSHSFTL